MNKSEADKQNGADEIRVKRKNGTGRMNRSEAENGTGQTNKSEADKWNRADE